MRHHMPIRFGLGALFVVATLFCERTFARPQSGSSTTAGHCLAFDGIDDLARVVRSPSLEPDEVTVELWARLDGPQDWNTRLVRKAGHFGDGYFISADQDFDERMQLQVHKTALLQVKDTQPHSAYAGTWHHFAGVYGLSHAELWVDGVLVNETDHNFGAMSHLPLTDLFIGAGVPSPAPSEYFAGRIDEVRIWNYPRTHAEVQANWNRTLTGGEAGLVAYWRFDEGAGQVAHDSSPSANHGSLGSTGAAESSDPSWVVSDAPIVAGSQSEVVGWGRMRFDSSWNQESFTSVRAGFYHSLALRADGSAVAWGNSWWGACDVPQAPPGRSYVKLSGGHDHTIALLDDGQVVAWGRNEEGQCNVPALPAGLTYVDFDAGYAHNLALRSDGSVVAWGYNQAGQCNVPALPPGLTYVEVSGGVWHSLARRSDGSVVAWGENVFGQCNVPALPAGLTYVHISAGGYDETIGPPDAAHNVAIRSDGSAVAWGSNSFGQCNVPVLPPGLAFVEVGAGGWHSVARLSDDSVIAWGRNNDGQCDVPSLPAGSHFVAVSAGCRHNVAQLQEGKFVVWGNADHFQLDAPRPPSGLSFVEVSAGGTHEVHALARVSDGSAIAWGYNAYGQCNVPALPPGLAYVEVDAGAHMYSVARLSDGSVVAWGDNSSGQCNVPALPPGIAYTQVAAGDRHVLARRSDGSVVAWGDNAFGQCNVPALPPGLSYVEVSASYPHSAARRSDGTVVAWGSNVHGQCNVPALPPGVTYVEIRAGYECIVARRSDGSVVAWGDNSLGQCNVPALPPGTTYVEIAAGAQYWSPYSTWTRSNTLARRSDGTIVVWGDTGSGQAAVPAIPPGMTVQQLSAGGLFTMARLGSGPDCDQPSSYCIGAINTTGHGASIGFLGSTSIAANDLVLLASGGPPLHAGIFFFGTFQTQIPFGEGYLCVTGNQHRLTPVVVLNASGAGSLALDYTNQASPASLLSAGSVWNFQFWYRDPQPVANGFNFTNALNAHFCP